MKTMERITKAKAGLGKVALLLIGFVLAVSSCNDEVTPTSEDFSAEDYENASSDALEDASADDAEDLASGVLEEEDAIGGKMATTDDRVNCAVITKTGTKNSGSIRIDFGSGCTDARGNVRRGAIIIDYAGRWRIAGSYWRLRFDNYFFNDVAVDGVRTVTNITTDTTKLTFTVELEDGTAKFPDGSVARRRVHHRRVHERDDSNNLLDRLIIYGTAEGNHRNGRGFYIEILEPLVYVRRCVKELGFPLPVSGVKLIKHGQRELTVDYGDGRCDNIVTLINKNGRKWEYRVGN